MKQDTEGSVSEMTSSALTLLTHKPGEAVGTEFTKYFSL